MERFRLLMEKDPWVIPQVSPVSICYCSVSPLRRAATRWLGLGQAVLLRNHTRADIGDTRFSTAAGEQLGYLLNDAPRADSGAISHREGEVELWCVLRTLSILTPHVWPGGTTNISFCALRKSRSDFIYMAPPFIAYFGALQDDAGGLALLQAAYDQIRLYRDALFDSNVSLWRHIALGSSQDSGHWATGTPKSPS